MHDRLIVWGDVVVMVEGQGGRVVELLTQDLLAEILIQNHVTSF